METLHTIDPVWLEIYRHLFTALTEEMGAALRRAAHSPNITERRDYSCALFDAAGRPVAQGDHMPVHLGAMPLSVSVALAHCAPLEPGDVIAYDATLWHGGGANRTALPRRALHVLWVRPWVQPHWDVAASLPAPVVAGLDEERRRLLGFTARPRRFDLTARRTVRPIR